MLRLGTSADLGFIRSLAGRPDYRPFITDESEEILSGYLDGSDYQVLIWEPEGQPAGFAIFSEIGEPSGRVMLMRLALAEAGKGEGCVFLRTLIDHAFTAYSAGRIWLDCSGENTRAMRAYQRAGFALEARLRSHEFVPALGRNVDTLLYGMLRADWEALEPLSPRF
jgi:RimJ/RimL family protein N-acetyltransferase